MIKKLHYVWLGGKPLPASVKSSIKTWKKHLPDWEIIQWDETNFDVNKYRWVREAIESKKYAFASDFIRLCVLNTYGGGYADTDVEIKRNLDPILQHSACFAIENHNIDNGLNKFLDENTGKDTRTDEIVPGFGIQAGFFYVEKNHPFIQKCLEDYYDNGNRRFVNNDGSNNSFVIDGALMEELNKYYGLKYKDEKQLLKDDIIVYDSSIFATKLSASKDSFLIHWFDQSWKDFSGIKALKRYIRVHLFFLFRRCWTYKKT